jgi:N-acetylglucosaminyl-diphospho-decaprenol L-rhamnosyltransferase
MKLLVVIVNFRTADLTADCLRSLAPEVAAVPGSTRVVVTDNLSGDDSVARLNTIIHDNGMTTWCTLMPLPRNGGFAYGNNAGIRPYLSPASPDDKPDYVLLLNPDTVVLPGGLTELIRFMDARPDVGIAGSRLEDPDGTPQVSAFRFHGILSEFEHGLRFGPVSKLLSRWRVAPSPVPTEPCPTDWVSGASLIVRREVFETVGLLDERYFMYYEEVDFCLRARRAGFTCWYVPTSRVVHFVGAASQISDHRKHRRRRPAYWFESRRRYFTQNHGRPYALLADAAYATAFWRIRRAIQRKPDPDPPQFLTDFLRHSTFGRGLRLS